MIAEDLGIFFADFGVSVTLPSGLDILGLLDQPDDVLGAGGMVLSSEYNLTLKTDDASGIMDGDILVIDGDSYEIRQIRKVQDGALSSVLLSKV